MVRSTYVCTLYTRLLRNPVHGQMPPAPMDTRHDTETMHPPVFILHFTWEMHLAGCSDQGAPTSARGLPAVQRGVPVSRPQPCHVTHQIPWSKPPSCLYRELQVSWKHFIPVGTEDYLLSVSSAPSVNHLWFYKCILNT